jgi:drug/metabolite transporter (DMT)-like permease
MRELYDLRTTGRPIVVVVIVQSLERRRLTLLLAMATIYLVWGSTYLAIRVMVETVPPLLAAGFRFVVAGAILYAVLAGRGGIGRLRITRRELLASFLIGALLLAGGNGLVTLAEREAPSGLAALIIAAIPLWVVLLRLVSRERVPPVTLAGVACGFAGIAFLVAPGGRPGGIALWSLFTLVAASAAWAAGSFFSRHVPLPRDLFVATAAEMVLGGALLLVIGLAAGEAPRFHVESFSGRSIGAWMYMVTAGSLLAFTAYVWLLHNAPISTVATYAFVNPVVAVLLGWSILSEKLTAGMLGAAALIVGSVWLVVRKEGGELAEPAPEPLPAEPEA